MRLIFSFLIAVAIVCGAGPQRIISTAPSITETLFAMGLGPRVVGVTIYCKYPAEVLKLPKIGTYLKPDMETIIALHPDLVVVQQQSNHVAEQLARLHIPYVEVESHNLESVYAGARTIGKAAGVPEAAEKLVHSMQQQLAEIKAKTVGKPKLSTVFIAGHNPGRLEGLIACASQCYFSDLMEIAGGTNIFHDSYASYPKVSLEEILSRNPEVILELSGDTKAKQNEIITLWQMHPTVRAVANHRVYPISAPPFLVPGPRAVEAARTVLHLLHPELQP